jgi:hypothetical protein
MQQSHSFRAKAPETMRRAQAVCLSQGIAWEPTGDTSLVRLGVAEATVRDAEFVDCQNWTVRWAPPWAITPVRSEAFSEGTLDELRQRLAIIAMIDVLVGREVANDDLVVSAIGFLSAFAGPTPVPEGIAYVDFVAWRALSGDLAAWFELRFAKSRVFAI